MTQANGYPKKLLSLLLSVALLAGLFLIPSVVTRADETLNPVVTDVNSPSIGADFDNVPTYVAADQTFSFTMPKEGTLLLTYSHEQGAYPSVNVQNAAGTRISYNASLNSEANSAPVKHRFYNLAKGTYSVSVTGTIAFNMICAPNAGTLKSGAPLHGGIGANLGLSYYKITVKKPGKLQVNLADETGISSAPSFQVQLLNSKKKALTQLEYMSSTNKYQTTYGVKKGTYYIAVKASAYSVPMYSVKATFKAIKTKAGASKKKAVNLKRNKKVSGVIYAANKKKSAKQWYKIKLKKPAKIKLSVNTAVSAGTGSGKLNVSISSPKLRGTSTNYFSYSKPKDTITLFLNQYDGKQRKLPAGTYYICINGENYGNGSYTLKWK